MAYTVRDYKTKKELKAAVASGVEVHIYTPGIGITKPDGIEYLEGPHYPEPHRWYAKVQMKDGKVVKVY